VSLNLGSPSDVEEVRRAVKAAQMRNYKEDGRLAVRRKGPRLFHFKHYSVQKALQLEASEREAIETSVRCADPGSHHAVRLLIKCIIEDWLRSPEESRTKLAELTETMARSGEVGPAVLSLELLFNLSLHANLAYDSFTVQIGGETSSDESDEEDEEEAGRKARGVAWIGAMQHSLAALTASLLRHFAAEQSVSYGEREPSGEGGNAVWRAALRALLFFGTAQGRVDPSRARLFGAEAISGVASRLPHASSLETKAMAEMITSCLYPDPLTADNGPVPLPAEELISLYMGCRSVSGRERLFVALFDLAVAASQERRSSQPGKNPAGPIEAVERRALLEACVALGLPNRMSGYFRYTPAGLADALSKQALPLLADGCSKTAAYSVFNSLERMAATYTRGARAPGSLDLPLDSYTLASRSGLEAQVRKGLEQALLTLAAGVFSSSSSSSSSSARVDARRLAVAEVVHVAASPDKGVALVGWGAMESLATGETAWARWGFVACWEALMHASEGDTAVENARLNRGIKTILRYSGSFAEAAMAIRIFDIVVVSLLVPPERRGETQGSQREEGAEHERHAALRSASAASGGSLSHQLRSSSVEELLAAGRFRIDADVLQAVEPGIWGHLFRSLPAAGGPHGGFSGWGALRVVVLALGTRMSSEKEAALTAMGGLRFYEHLLEDAEPQVAYLAARFLLSHLEKSKPEEFPAALRHIVLKAQELGNPKLFRNPYLMMCALLPELAHVCEVEGPGPAATARVA